MAPPPKSKQAAKPSKPPDVPLFAWEGKDKKGNKASGETRAATQAAVRADLRRQGVTPTKITKKSTFKFSMGKQPITAKDIAIFARQLATMMASGVPVVQSFDIVGRGHPNPSMQDLILSLKGDVEGGTSLANALRNHPLEFDDLFCSLVEAGEAAGVLDELLDKIASYKEKTESMKAKVKAALVYPISVIVVVIAVTAVLLIFVIPQFKKLFDDFGAELPAFTLMVVHMSEFVQEWWWVMIGVLVGFGYTIAYIHKRSAEFRAMVDRTMLKLPVIGVIIEKSAIARFARTLSTIFAAGVPLVQALESVAGATGNIVFFDAVMRMRSCVAEGQSLQLSMKQQNLFPHMVIQMTAIGEESGSLDKMLSKVADFYEEEVDALVDGLSALMEPIIMVVVGILVGGMIVAMYLPIFQMAQAV